MIAPLILPAQNSLGVQTFRDSRLGGKNFIMLFYATLFPKQKMLMFSSNINIIRKEVLKEIRHLQYQAQAGTCWVPGPSET